MNLNKAQRAALKSKYGGRCAYCGCVLGERWQADHLVAVRRISRWVPGKGHVATGKVERPQHDRLENMMPACPPCNNYKHAFSLEGFRKALEHTPDVLERDSTTFRHAARFGLVLLGRTEVVFHFETYAKRKRRRFTL